MTVPLIQEIQPAQLALYDQVPSRLLVRSILRVEELDHGLGGFRLVEEPAASPYLKEYDASGDRPSGWPSQFDVSQWGFFLAVRDTVVIGGAAVALGCRPFPLDPFARPDLAVLWDLRVAPEEQGRGTGTLLFEHAAAWARSRGSGQLGLETQNVNVPACRFYSKQGCRLGAIHRYGYAGRPEVAHEAMLLWYLDL
jgi:GNAT superfamily N-acetyltransferase